MTVEIIPDTAHLRHRVVLYHRDGWSIRQLSRYFGIGRNRVRRMLRTAQKQRAQEQPPPPGMPTRTVATRSSKLDAYLPQMTQLLQRYPDLTGVRMREELRVLGYDGGITILRERLKRLRPKPSREPVIRFETDPGVQGQMDWSPYTLRFANGRKSEVICYSYILGFSRRQYIDFTTSRDHFSLIRRHRDTFEYFGGVPLQCLYDNEKTVVLRWEAGQPIFNPAFIDFITHYRCKPIACQIGRAKTKGKIERPFQYVEDNLLNGRTFQNLEDLRSVARWWLREKSDTHIHDTTHRAPLEMFMADEQTFLQPLPVQPYDCAEVLFKVCPPDAFVEFETNRYSVGFEHIGEIIVVKATDCEICIYNSLVDRIAQHPRHAHGACRIEESPEHRRDRSLRYGLQPVQEAFERIGSAAVEFLAGLKEKHPRNPGLHARLILQLKERYCVDDINRALTHALRYYAFDAASVERILQAHAKPRTLESVRNEHARDQLQDKLPPVKQRHLDEYTTLLNAESAHEEASGSGPTDTGPLQNPQAPDNPQESR